jgi:AmpD protein
LAEYNYIYKENIKAHSEVAPGRKTDPGILFDWDKYLSNV